MATIISRFELGSKIGNSFCFVELGTQKDDVPFVRYQYFSMKAPRFHYYQRDDFSDALAIARNDYFSRVSFLLSQV